MIRNRVQNSSVVGNVLKHSKLTTRCAGKEAFKLKSHFGEGLDI